MGLKHLYKSLKSDPPDSTIIGPTKWNTDHYFLDSSENPVGAVGDLAYRGTDGIVSLVTGAQGLLASAGSGNVPAYTMTPTVTTITATVVVAADLWAANTGLRVRDTDASHLLAIKPGSNLAADRTLTLTTGDADRTITLSGNPTLADWFDQSVKVAASPTFAAITTAGSLQLGTSKINMGTTDGNLLITNEDGDDFNLLMFGDITSSYPALKRVTTTLICQLADDSARAAFGSLYQYFGSGSPEGAVTAPVGSIYHRTDGGANTSLYVKQSGAGNTGWAAITP